jgi:hypothetical protein
MPVRSRMYARLLLLLGLSIGRRWDAEGKNVLENLVASFTEKRGFKQGDNRDRDAATPTWPVREGSVAEDKSRFSRLKEENASRTDHRRDSVARRLPYYHSSEEDCETKPPAKSPHFTWPPSVRAFSFAFNNIASTKLVVERSANLFFAFSLHTMGVCDQFRARM